MKHCSMEKFSQFFLLPIVFITLFLLGVVLGIGYGKTCQKELNKNKATTQLETTAYPIQKDVTMKRGGSIVIIPFEDGNVWVKYCKEREIDCDTWNISPVIECKVISIWH